MIRIGVSICFALTLLCPVFCLAETVDECSAHASPDGENCEAMSIGAVVEKPSRGIALPDQSIRSFDGLRSLTQATLDPNRRLRWATEHREWTKPPPTAGRRHAVLQSFLF